jgi:23S rRNA pseudouridine2605 synthase
VRDLVGIPGTVYPVGRLDVDSEGLILLTNDGELANRLTHPRYGHEKEYKVLVARHPDDEQLEAFRRGVVLEDGHRTAPANVRVDTLAGKGAWLRVILKEGHKRQIREVCTLLGLPVVKLIRIRIGSLLLGGMKPREWRHLSPEEIKALKEPAQPVKTPQRVVRKTRPDFPKPRRAPEDRRRAPEDRRRAPEDRRRAPEDRRRAPNKSEGGSRERKPASKGRRPAQQRS